MKQGFIGDVAAWIAMFVLIFVFAILFTLKGCNPSLQQSQAVVIQDLGTRQEDLMMLRQPVIYAGQNVTLAYVISRLPLKDEAKDRESAILAALHQAQYWQMRKHCIIAGTPDDLRSYVQQLALRGSAAWVPPESIRTALSAFGCKTDFQNVAVITLATADNNPLQVIVADASGDYDTVYKDSQTELRVK
jgi:hypothetical protein